MEQVQRLRGETTASLDGSRQTDTSVEICVGEEDSSYPQQCRVYEWLSNIPKPSEHAITSSGEISAVNHAPGRRLTPAPQSLSKSSHQRMQSLPDIHTLHAGIPDHHSPQPVSSSLLQGFQHGKNSLLLTVPISQSDKTTESTTPILLPNRKLMTKSPVHTKSPLNHPHPSLKLVPSIDSLSETSSISLSSKTSTSISIYEAQRCERRKYLTQYQHDPTHHSLDPCTSPLALSHPITGPRQHLVTSHGHALANGQQGKKWSIWGSFFTRAPMPHLSKSIGSTGTPRHAPANATTDKDANMSSISSPASTTSDFSHSDTGTTKRLEFMHGVRRTSVPHIHSGATAHANGTATPEGLVKTTGDKRALSYKSLPRASAGVLRSPVKGFSMPRTTKHPPAHTSSVQSTPAKMAAVKESPGTVQEAPVSPVTTRLKESMNMGMVVTDEAKMMEEAITERRNKCERISTAEAAKENSKTNGDVALQNGEQMTVTNTTTRITKKSPTTTLPKLKTADLKDDKPGRNTSLRPRSKTTLDPSTIVRDAGPKSPGIVQPQPLVLRQLSNANKENEKKNTPPSSRVTSPGVRSAKILEYRTRSHSHTGECKYGVTREILGKGAHAVVKLAHKRRRETGAVHGNGSNGYSSGSVYGNYPSSASSMNGDDDDCSESEHLWAIKGFARRRRDETEKAYIKKLSAEFCTSSSLHHENVIETVDLIRDEHNRWCEVMEYMPGGDLLERVLKGPPLTQTQILCYFKQLLTGIAYLISMGVAHRDLKPENLLLDKEGKVLKITDFGASLVFRCPWETKGRLTKGLCGSDPYVAPEEWVEDEYDPTKVDVWSAAVILYVMIAGSLPWNAARRNDPAFSQYLRCQSLPHLPTDIDPKVKALLFKVLEVRPELRSSAEELLEMDILKSAEMCQKGQSSQHSHVKMAKSVEPKSRFMHMIVVKR